MAVRAHPGGTQHLDGPADGPHLLLGPHSALGDLADSLPADVRES